MDRKVSRFHTEQNSCTAGNNSRAATSVVIMGEAIENEILIFQYWLTANSNFFPMFVTCTEGSCISADA